MEIVHSSGEWAGVLDDVVVRLSPEALLGRNRNQFVWEVDVGLSGPTRINFVSMLNKSILICDERLTEEFVVV